MENEVYYCKECNIIHPSCSSCWELEGEFICSTCFSEIKVIKLKDLKKYTYKIKLNDKNLEDFKKNKLEYMTPKQKKEILDVLNNEIRKQKIMKLFDNE